MNNLKVYLKFHETNGNLVGFVTKKSNQSWIGCNENDVCRKSIVVISKNLKDIKPKVLYRTTLLPMKDKHGFVAINATPVQFDAVIDTFYKDNNFKVVVSFGNKKIEYNPLSSSPKKNDVATVILQLKERDDLKDKESTIVNFNEAVISAKNALEKYA